MNNILLPYINIRYRLVPEADTKSLLVPYKLGLSDFVLRSRAKDYIKPGDTMEIPTGVAIEDFPEYTVPIDGGREISYYMEASCRSLDELVIDQSLVVTGPTTINREYGNNEIWVCMTNMGKLCKTVEKNMPVALLTFTLKPRVQLQLDDN